MDSRIGDTICDATIERFIDRGGMGAVYLARRADGQQLVVKVLSPEIAANPALRKRFQREGRALQRLPTHPHIVKVLEVSGGEEPAILMEYVPGGSLQDLLRRTGRPAPLQAARIARDAALALSVIHSQGLVHRDVKPANVLVGEGVVKLVDLGLAKDVFQSGLTQPGQLMGTIQYMAPEQWRGEPADARCDVFGLGATLYHLLTGRPPFQGADASEVSELAMMGEYPPLQEAAVGTPPELERVVTQMLEPELRYRYQDAKQCADDLDRILLNRPTGMPALVSADHRLVLLPGDRFVVGRDPGCSLHLDHPGVDPRHAQLRRKAQGFVLYDLRSQAGTWVGPDKLVEDPRPLQDGDRVRLGSLELRFDDPAGRERPPPFLRDVQREVQPQWVVEQLLVLPDLRGVASLIELLQPDSNTDRAVLAQALEPDELAAVLAERQVELARIESWAGGRLVAMTGEQLGAQGEAWLNWWDRARDGYPLQVGVAARDLRLEIAGGQVLELGDSGVLTIGSDEACQVRLAQPGVQGTHAAILRLHGRLVVRDECGATLLGGRSVRTAFLNPGATLTLGSAHLRVVQGESGEVDAKVFDALVRRRHPSTAVALVDALRSVGRVDEARQRSAVLCAGQPELTTQLGERLAGVLRDRYQAARQVLPHLLGGDAGEDLTGWSRLLESRRAQLPAQLQPRL